MAPVNQIVVWVLGLMTAFLQVTDNNVAHRMKAQAAKAHERLRVELNKLAEGEPNQDILVAMNPNGWLSLRPPLSQGT